MAKAVGLDAGEYEIKVVELDGSLKKPKLTKVSIDKVAHASLRAGDEGHAQREAAVALHALRDAKLGKDSVALGFPSREAVVRILHVPFTGDDAIRKVIKFEAEGEIHSHNVDEMVVDFHNMGAVDGGSKVLIAAVPKRPLGITLAALARAGIEPETVDLDALALYRCAKWVGVFDEQPEVEGGEDDDSALALPDAASTVLVIDVGARSTKIVAVNDGELVDMRVPRIGVDSIAEDLSEGLSIDMETARDAVLSVLETGDDYVFAGVEADEDEGGDSSAEDDRGEGEDGGDEALVAVSRDGGRVSREQVMIARDRFLMRLRREFMRCMTSMPMVHSVGRVLVTGGGSNLPGLDDCLEETFQVGPEILDVLGRLNHNLDEDDVAWIGPRIAVAVGLALGHMGASPRFNFRQEELAFKRRFDRIKFPLAIACMLGIFYPFIYGMGKFKELTHLEMQYGKLHSVTEGKGSGRGSKNKITAKFQGYVGRLINGRPDLNAMLGMKEANNLVKDVVAQPTFKRLTKIRQFYKKQLEKKKAETGIFDDLQLPSGYYVLAYFASVIKRLEAELGKSESTSFLVTELELNLPAQARTRHLTFKVALRGESFRIRHARLEEVLAEEFKKPECPFQAFGRAAGEQIFRESKVPGATYQIRLDLKERWDPVGGNKG